MYVFWFFDLRIVFYVTAVGLRVFGLGFDVVFQFFDLMLLFVRYCGWFKGVGSKLRGIFFLFRPEASFSMLLRLVKVCGVKVLMYFFGFST